MNTIPILPYRRDIENLNKTNTDIHQLINELDEKDNKTVIFKYYKRNDNFLETKYILFKYIPEKQGQGTVEVLICWKLPENYNEILDGKATISIQDLLVEIQKNPNISITKYSGLDKSTKNRNSSRQYNKLYEREDMSLENMYLIRTFFEFPEIEGGSKTKRKSKSKKSKSRKSRRSKSKRKKSKSKKSKRSKSKRK